MSKSTSLYGWQAENPFNPLEKMFWKQDLFRRTGGSKNFIEFACGCQVTFFVPPVDVVPNYEGFEAAPGSSFFRFSRKNLCDLHRGQDLGLYDFRNPAGFYFNCRGCDFPLSAMEGDFSCESKWSEYDAAVHASQEYGGFCDGVEFCPICHDPVPYEKIFEEYEAWRFDELMERHENEKERFYPDDGDSSF